jgi:hypothetical protein
VPSGSPSSNAPSLGVCVPDKGKSPDRNLH